MQLLFNRVGETVRLYYLSERYIGSLYFLADGDRRTRLAESMFALRSATDGHNGIPGESFRKMANRVPRFSGNFIVPAAVLVRRD